MRSINGRNDGLPLQQRQQSSHPTEWKQNQETQAWVLNSPVPMCPRILHKWMRRQTSCISPFSEMLIFALDFFNAMKLNFLKRIIIQKTNIFKTKARNNWAINIECYFKIMHFYWWLVAGICYDANIIIVFSDFPIVTKWEGSACSNIQSSWILVLVI